MKRIKVKSLVSVLFLFEIFILGQACGPTFKVNEPESLQSIENRESQSSALVGPQIEQQPLSQVINLGSQLRLSVQASGSAPLNYTWLKDGVEIPGALDPILFISNANSADQGSYSVIVGNAVQKIQSESAIVSVKVLETDQSSGGSEEADGSTAEPPVVSLPPVSDSVDMGGNPQDPTMVPVIIAQGLRGRTTISCDDGQTWIAERDFDKEGNDLVCGNTQPVVCGVTSCKRRTVNGSCETSSPCDCLHDVGYGKGIAFGDGKILANFGWGGAGAILHSADGASWKTFLVFDAGYLYPNFIYGDGQFVHFSSQPRISTDGLQWRNGGFANFNGPGQSWKSPRAFDYLDYFGSSRLIGAIDGDIIRVSEDGGATWLAPQKIPSGCANGIGDSQRILTGNNVAVIITTDGKSCRTGDGGRTWTLHSISTSSVTPYGIFNQGLFLAWGNSGGKVTRWSSADGMTWTATAMNTNTTVGAVGKSPLGTLVTTNGLWTDYKSQVFLRSTDGGLTWNSLPSANYVKSHGIHRFGSGYIRENTLCRR